MTTSTTHAIRLRAELVGPLSMEPRDYTTAPTGDALAELVGAAIRAACLHSLKATARGYGVDVTCGSCWLRLELGAGFGWKRGDPAAWWVNWMRGTGEPRGPEPGDLFTIRGVGHRGLAQVLADLIALTLEEI